MGDAMNSDGSAGDDLRCAQVVELVTDYLEGALDDDTHRRFERHLATCAGCDAYLAQMRRAVSALGTLRPEQLSPELCARLTDAFRGWRTGRRATR